MHKVLVSIALAFWAMAGWAGPVTVVALGDSLVHGFGLTPEDGFVPQMEAALQAQGQDVRMINAGVSGDTTAGGAARVDWTLSDDVDAMIVVLGGNDMLRGIGPETVRANLHAILSAASNRNISVLLVGMEAPGNYGPDYKQAFDAAYPDLAAEFDAVLYPNFFATFAEEERTPEALREFMQADGIHPNAKGVARIVAHMAPSVVALIDRAGGD
ncbi:MAG: arylesterase [Paracoccaceae bacterium]